MAFRRKNETEQDQMTPQYPPICIESFDQPVPVQVIGARTQQMGDISSVITFSFHDVGLLPDHFFGWNDFELQTEDRGLASMLEPDIIYTPESVPRAENDVNIHKSGLNFRQPVSKGVVSLITGFFPYRQCWLDLLGPNEEVKIFGVPVNLCVLSQRIRASNQKVDVILAKQPHNSLANLASGLRFHSMKGALLGASAAM